MCTILGATGAQLTRQELEAHFAATHTRGPDDQALVQVGSCWLGFQRLAIMDLSPRGMQPFSLEGDYVVCNGEIYGFRALRRSLEGKYPFHSDSDCEVLLPLYREYGRGMFSQLGSEFALVLYDHRTDALLAARDPLGIRPLYYGTDRFGETVFASEPKDLVGLCQTIAPFPPGHYWEGGRFHRYIDLTTVTQFSPDDEETACRKIRDLLVRSVQARLDADAPLGFLLSGGLDSSLVCAISAKLLGKPIRTFAIGMDTDPIDLKYAQQAAEYLGADHTAFTMTRQEVLEALPEVVALLGTWDITTIRASLGMYLCCKKIREATDLRVLMTGEISDELFGYKYTDFAPSDEAFQGEAKKRVDEIHTYDVLRADRCIAANSMEGRVPFGDSDLVRYVMSIHPKWKRNRHGVGKYLLRKAFQGEGLLPDGILWREKAAFSDAVGHSMVDDLKAYAEAHYTDEEFQRRRLWYPHGTPFTKESLLYREIFEQHYPGQGGDDPCLLDAKPVLGRVRGGRSLCPGAVQLRCQRPMSGCNRTPRQVPTREPVQ